MIFRVELRGRDELIARLDAMPERVHQALLEKMSTLTAALAAKVIDKLSDDVLHVRTGELRRSISMKVDDDGDVIRGTVYSAANSPANKYAAIQEYGGTIHIPDIYPTKAQALHFVIDGKDVFAKMVRAHDVTIPERSFLRSSLEEMQDDIVSGIKDAILEGLQK